MTSKIFFPTCHLNLDRNYLYIMILLYHATDQKTKNQKRTNMNKTTQFQFYSPSSSQNISAKVCVGLTLLYSTTQYHATPVQADQIILIPSIAFTKKLCKKFKFRHFKISHFTSSFTCSSTSAEQQSKFPDTPQETVWANVLQHWVAVPLQIQTAVKPDQLCNSLEKSKGLNLSPH